MIEVEMATVADAGDPAFPPGVGGPYLLLDRRTDILKRPDRDEGMGDPEKINILVVDDLPDKLLVFSSILEELGQNVITARSGEEGLRRVLEHDFAVVLLDVNMPGMDGVMVLEALRLLNPAVRCYFMTGGFDRSLLAMLREQARQRAA